MGQLGAIGVNRNGGGGGHSGEFMCLHLRDLPLSARHSFGWGRSPETPVSRDLPCLSAHAVSISGYVPMSQVSAHGVSMLSADLSVKLFACCLMFMFQLAQVFTTSSGCSYRMPAAQRISVASFPGGWVWLHPGGRWWYVGIGCAGDWGFQYPNVGQSNDFLISKQI